MKKGFILGLTTGIVLTGASLVLANSQIQAILNDQIKVTLNGQVQKFKDETTNETQYPITYHDRTYLPLRTVANLVGVDVDYDAGSNMAILKNDILKEIISKAEESIRFPLMDGKGNVLNAVACKVKSIDIYDIEYMKTIVESYDNKTGIFENIDEGNN